MNIDMRKFDKIKWKFVTSLINYTHNFNTHAWMINNLKWNKAVSVSHLPSYHTGYTFKQECTNVHSIK